MTRRRPIRGPLVLTAVVAALAAGCGQRENATGVSNGGGFSARLGCELAAAVAPVAGGYRALEPCPSQRGPSLLEIHGTGDTVVPYRGRGPRRAGDVRRFVARWARRDGCHSEPDVARVRPGLQRVRYRGCAPGLAVEHLRIDDEPHGWPADAGAIVWRSSAGPSARRADEPREPSCAPRCCDAARRA